MRLFNNEQLLLRIMAAVTESILFYLGFLFANQIAGGSNINILFFILVALCGLFVNFLPYNSYDKRKHSLVFGSIGLALVILSIGISARNGFNLFALPVGFIALIFLYYRSYISYMAKILYVYTVESFYKSIVVLFIINAAVAFWHASLGAISEELMRYSVLYIIMALYLLSEVKNFRYVRKSENSRKTIFDILGTSFMIMITVIISIPKVFKIVIFPFAVVFQFIYGWVGKAILLITYPIARLFNYLYNLIPELDETGTTKPSYDMLDMSDKYKALEDINSPIVQFIGKALAFMIMLTICAYAVYLLYRFINRITRSEEEDDFVEDKEFVLRSRKKKTPGLISKLADSMKKAADNVSFMLTADNHDKLRNEYKAFIQKLYNKKIIEGDHYTAQDILELMAFRLPNQKNELTCITDIYEEVRYGAKYPSDYELKSFRKSIIEISKNLQQMK